MAAGKLVKWVIAWAMLLSFFSCYYLGCYPLKDACYDCCKKASKQWVGAMGGRRAYKAREGCTEECVEFAEKNGKDGYWVEDKQACGFSDPEYYLSE
ncbi:MAG: hypothetical protein D6806_12745 [Deltaproteobacteria bacterium]|nr:MAG: hypothetical protein D6806_12745 [Deltaproteobacteria bacterium]